MLALNDDRLRAVSSLNGSISALQTVVDAYVKLLEYVYANVAIAGLMINSNEVAKLRQEGQEYAMQLQANSEQTPESREAIIGEMNEYLKHTANRVNMTISREQKWIKNNEESRANDGWWGPVKRTMTASDPYQQEIDNASQKISNMEYAKEHFLAKAYQELGKPSDDINLQTVLSDIQKAERMNNIANKVNVDNSHWELDQHAIDVSRNVAVTAAVGLGTLPAALIAGPAITGFSSAVKVGAYYGGMISFADSTVRNVDDVQSGKKTVHGAALDVVNDTGTGAVTGAVTGGVIRAGSGAVGNTVRSAARGLRNLKTTPSIKGPLPTVKPIPRPSSGSAPKSVPKSTSSQSRGTYDQGQLNSINTRLQKLGQSYDDVVNAVNPSKAVKALQDDINKFNQSYKPSNVSYPKGQASSIPQVKPTMKPDKLLKGINDRLNQMNKSADEIMNTANPSKAVKALQNDINKANQVYGKPSASTISQSLKPIRSKAKIKPVSEINTSSSKAASKSTFEQSGRLRCMEKRIKADLPKGQTMDDVLNIKNPNADTSILQDKIRQLNQLKNINNLSLDQVNKAIASELKNTAVTTEAQLFKALNEAKPDSKYEAYLLPILEKIKPYLNKRAQLTG